MNIEAKLKNLILERYKSIREFTQVIDMSYSTLDSILKRGIDNSSVANIIKICTALHISVDALANGEIVPKYEARPSTPTTDVKDIVDDVKSRLSQTETLVINGRPVDIEYVEPIIEALDIGYEISRKKTVKAAENTTTKTITES